MSAARNQFGFAHNAFGLREIEKKRVAFDRFMGQPAAARLLPRQALVVDRNFEARAREPFAAQRSCRTASHNRYLFHGTRSQLLCVRLAETNLRRTTRRV